MILACDTSQQACSVALLKQNGDCFEKSEVVDVGHAEYLPLMMQEVMDDAEVKCSDLTELVVTVGPGSFIGLRVGLSFMRGLALACHLPLYGLNSLVALAVSAQEVNTESLEILSVIDARREQVYVQRFTSDLDPIEIPQIVSSEEYAKTLPEKPFLLIGTGADLIAPFLPWAQKIDMVKYPRPSAMIKLIKLSSPLIEASPNPIYLRLADAKLPSQDSVLCHESA